ncbi:MULTISPECIES: penicillin-binding protein 1C [unclassified Oceanispirochaeta]|uniref:penicillin-binding protein 1C n=1 Tax=unclassified Oceanispirochaeta TaxID=2635722 RepID=UPI0011C03697|nr:MULTISPECIES: penicillin-binding protein 1C [unclassified Oceanispirochaeta]MBF9016006.1 penicillin-binding protein 1C [Oceanispirochaeta sp. M2]NPD72469.1 penicillin-binding protein 1C [Oceanispirochaeta sp. M1]
MRYTAVAVPGLFILILLIPLPRPLFDTPRSTVLLDREDGLMGARIAADEQWRFPPESHIPDKYKSCVIRFEDKRFYYHPGVDLPAVLRSLYINIRAGEVLSGASTISMQVIRLAHPERPRTVPVKALEAMQALKLELLNSKEDILLYYASNAPYGGNTVGLSAAAWRYWNRNSEELSWAESALLAVLPNAPSLMHPGKNRDLLIEKRNNLLKSLASRGELDDLSLSLALEEPLPEKPLPLPSMAPHLLQRVILEKGEGLLQKSTLDRSLQATVQKEVMRHSRSLSYRGIYNAAVLVADLESGDVLAYAGNSPDDGSSIHGHSVDIITASRSTGSLLKPILFALSLQDGLILPDQMIKDTPVSFGTYSPENFHHSFDGAVPASNALIRSLNVPFVYLLQDYNYHRFHSELKAMGLSLPQPADHYGLALILGGAESSLWELTALFAGLGRRVKNPDDKAPFFDLRYDPDNEPVHRELDSPDAASLWFTFEAMKNLVRPEASWEYFQNSRDVAWKTGTSMGGRDAWAIGVTPRYAVGVWVGNADGEGRPGINGLKAAAPLLFDLIRQLPFDPSNDQDWFNRSLDGMQLEKICTVSGYKAGPNCPFEERLIPIKGVSTVTCPYHTLIHLDKEGVYRVDSRTSSVRDMTHLNWFVLPPVQEYYYRRIHNNYIPLPPFKGNVEQGRGISFIYPPSDAAVVKIPRLFDGEMGEVVFEAALRDNQSLLYWHLDGNYIGYTRFNHQMGIQSEPGTHRVSIVDEKGNSAERLFEFSE